MRNEKKKCCSKRQHGFLYERGLYRGKKQKKLENRFMIDKHMQKWRKIGREARQRVISRESGQR